MIPETLSQKPSHKLNFFKYKSIQSIVIYPVILLILLYLNFNIENIDWKYVLGSVFAVSVLTYLIYINLKTFKALKDLDLGTDMIVESTRKSNNVKSVFNSRYKNALFTLPVLYSGIVLIIWNNISINSKTIFFMSALFIVMFLYNLKGPRIHKNMIGKLEKDILELKELTI